MLNWFYRKNTGHILTGMAGLMIIISSGFWLLVSEDEIPSSLVLDQKYTWADSISIQEEENENKLDPSRFFEPEQQDKPWIVWHWPGTDVDLRSVLEDLSGFAQKGFGGVEIHVSAKGIQPSQRKGNFRDPSWIYLLQQASAFGKSIGLQIDWTIGPGIPAEYTEGQKMLTWGEIHMLGGRELTCVIPAPSMPVGHHFSSSLNRTERQDDSWLGWSPDSSRLLGCWISQVMEDHREVAFWETSDQLILNPDSTWNVTSFLKGDTLTGWKAGPGYWKLIAVYETPSGATPFHSVASFSEHIADLMSPQDLKAGLIIHPEFESIPYDSTGEQAVRFLPQKPAVDLLIPESFDQFIYEIGESSRKGVLPLLLCEPFRDHSGANRHHLSASPSYVLSNQDDQLRLAYERWRVSEPFLKGLESLSGLLHGKGSHTRMAVDDWPFGWEQICREVDQVAFHQDISGANRLSASLVSNLAYSWGRKYIAAYVGAGPDMAYENSPEKLKQQIDLAYLAGGNRVFVESEAYQPRTADRFWHPGIDSYLQGVNEGGQFGEDDPMGKWWPDLWKYTARTCYLNKLGKKQTDVLVLFPFSRFPERLHMEEWSMIPGYDPSKIDQLSGVTMAMLDQKEDQIISWIRRLSPYLTSLEQNGITWDWVTQTMITEMNSGLISGEGFQSEGPFTLIIPEGGEMNPETGSALIQLHDNQAARVLILGETSPMVTTLMKPDSSQQILTENLDKLRPQFSLNNGKQLCTRLMSENLQNAYPFLLSSPAIRKQVRVLEDGSSLLFLTNTSSEESDLSIFLGEESGWELDPYSGKASQVISEAGGLYALTFFPHESRYFWLGESPEWPDSLQMKPEIRLSSKMVYQAGIQAIPLDSWEWTYPDPAASGPEVITDFRDLKSWTEVDGLESYHGEVAYRTDLYLEALDPSIEYFLDLGTVLDVMELEINTRPVLLRPWPPYLVSLKPLLQPGLNTISVWVKNTRRNEMVSRTNQGDPSVNWLQATQSDLQPAGLLGPVYVWKIGGEASF